MSASLNFRITEPGRMRSTKKFSLITFSPPPGPRNYMTLVTQRGRMEGFIVLDYLPRFAEASQQLAAWMAEGKIAHQEDIQHGLENAPRTLRRLFEGRNLGKQLLKLAEAPLGGEPTA